MAGPAASVWVNFRGRYVPSWHDVLSPFACSWYEPDFCYLNDTRRFGGTYTGEPRPFVGSLNEFSPFSEHSVSEVQAIAAQTHRDFSHFFIVAAMCNQKEDQRILAELCAAIAEKHDGLVNFDALEAPVEELGLQRCSWGEDGEWTILGTATAARRWLEHERFYMVK